MPANRKKFLRDSAALKRWNRFLELEEKFIGVETYVLNGMDSGGKHVNLITEPVYSNQFKSIIIKASEEFVLQAAEVVGFSGQRITIDELGEKLSMLYPHITEVIVDTDYIDIAPLGGWKKISDDRRLLDWWMAYSNLKHGREREFIYATLQYALKAMGALFVLNLYSLKNEYGNISMVYDSKRFRVGIMD